MSIGRYDHINTRTGRAGHIRTSSGFHHRISRKVGGQAQEKRRIVVDTAADSTAYSIVLDGTTVAITSGVGATKNSIVAQFIAAIEAVSALYSAFSVVEDDGNTDRFTITARDNGNAFTLTAGANLTASLVTAADAGDAIPPGTVVVQDPNDSEAAILPGATTVAAVAQVHDLTPEATNNATYQVAIAGDFDGDGIEEVYVFPNLADGDATQAEIVDAQVALINDKMPASSILAANASDKLRLTAEQAGLPFEARGTSNHATTGWTVTEVTANVEASSTFTYRPLGVVALEQRLELPSAGGLVEFEVGDCLTICEVDEVCVLLDDGETVAEGDSVYVRCTAGATEQLGACRNDTDAGDCVLLSGARFTSANFTGLDGQNVAYAKINRF